MLSRLKYDLTMAEAARGPGGSRVDLLVVADMVQPGARVLDLGARSGSFTTNRQDVLVVRLDLEIPACLVANLITKTTQFAGEFEGHNGAHAVTEEIEWLDEIALEGLRERTGSARLTQVRLGLAKELLREALSTREAEFPSSG